MDRRCTEFAIVSLLAATVIATQGCEKPAKVTTPHPLAAALRSAPSVTAYRVDEKRIVDRSSVQVDFVRRAEGTKLAKTEQARLADALDKIDFGPRDLKACEFAPGAEYRFMRDKDEISLRVCFHCNDLGFAWPGEKFFRTVDFGDVRAEFREIAKDVFRGDSEIQALK